MKAKFLHRDATLVVMHKPAGMTVYREPGSSGESAQDWVKSRVPGGQCHPVHRLDKGTCGVLVFALTPPIANLMQKLFREGKVDKHYRAIVEGAPPRKGEFRNPLTEPKTKESRTAITKFRTLETFDLGDRSFSLVDVDPKTGRFHQIRRHFSMNGFPLVGDKQYRGSERHLKRPALCAVRISFIHPGTRRPLAVETSPDADFQALVQKFSRRSASDTTTSAVPDSAKERP